MSTTRIRRAIDTPLLFVGNNDYSLELPDAGTRAALDDGKLCVMVMRKKGRAGFIAATLRVLVGRVRNDDMIRLDDASRLRVASRRTHLTLAIDGETAQLQTPLEFRIRRGALTVVAAAAAPVRSDTSERRVPLGRQWVESGHWHCLRRQL